MTWKSWDGETSMVPTGPFQALVRLGHAVIRTVQESAAVELEYEQAMRDACQLLLEYPEASLDAGEVAPKPWLRPCPNRLGFAKSRAA